MSLVSTIQDIGGAARISSLRSRGHSGYAIRAAIERGELQRLRSGWVALPTLRQLPLSAAARRLLDDCTPYSDSGLETLFKTRLSWVGVSIHPQTWLLGHRVDFLIGARLVVQIDGKQHMAEQKVADYKHDAALELRGYRVMRFSYAQVVHDWPAVQDAVLLALAQGWHRAA